ncbi:uncharacterized protein LODBEIA_P29200 [Lodderomyces beijingensis]|uniref:D-lactate dehydrogenase (cytochrome) n=1 Tax=Lodderomyces beijingensis TaxID=1775926 RepID=A0ABP0ZKM2_9ASCO
MIAIVGQANADRDAASIQAYGDQSFACHRPANPQLQRPGAVLKPTSTEQVSHLLRIAHEFSIPIVASSGLTSIEGQNIHTRGPQSVSISFENMNKILAFHPQDLDIVVQPGVGWENINAYLSESQVGSHLMFGPDPGPGANIGGMVGTSCSGTNAYRYGTMKENVVNLTVVLADGSVIKTKQRPRKSSAGYDMTHLFIGSEGTLGLVTEITLKLHVRPKFELVSVVSFPTIGDAARVASAVIASGIQPNAMEVLDERTISFVNNLSEKKQIAKPTLFFKFGGPTKDIIKTQIDLVKAIAMDHHMIEFRESKDDAESLELWEARRSGFFSTLAYGKQVLADTTDVNGYGTDMAVPVSKLAQVMEAGIAALQEAGFADKFSCMGHIGDGNYHFMILYNSPEYHQVVELAAKMVEQALDLEGTCTGEHGVGMGKRKFLAKELGQVTLDAERRIKLALDPKRILNPDKIFKIDPLDDYDEQLEKRKILAKPDCMYNH